MKVFGPLAAEGAPKPPVWTMLAVLLLAVGASLVGGCAGRDRLPPQAPLAVRVEVPIPVACEIEQVPQGERPSAGARSGMSIYDLTKIALAERRILLGEVDRLHAANNNPCPGAPRRD